MKSFSLTNLAFVLIFSLSLTGCVGDTQRTTPVTPQSPKDTAALSWFSSVQYAVKDFPASNVREILNQWSGQVLVTNPEATLKNLSNPPLGCLYEAQDGITGQLRRFMDVGEVKLRGPKVKERSADKTVLSNGNRVFYSLSGLVLDPGGPYFLNTGGFNNRLKWEQSFDVLDYGTNLSFQRTSDGGIFNIPAPQYDPNSVSVINKTEELLFNYTAPAGTTYVKVHFNDGGGDDAGANPTGNVNCYGSPQGPIKVPAGILSYFKTSAEGVAYIDFVNVSLKKDVPNVKESVILSTTRLIHGRKDFYLNDRKQEFYFGRLYFQ